MLIIKDYSFLHKALSLTWKRKVWEGGWWILRWKISRCLAMNWDEDLVKPVHQGKVKGNELVLEEMCLNVQSLTDRCCLNYHNMANAGESSSAKLIIVKSKYTETFPYKCAWTMQYIVLHIITLEGNVFYQGSHIFWHPRFWLCANLPSFEILPEISALPPKNIAIM